MVLSEAEFACPLAKVGIYSLSDIVVASQSTKSRLGLVNPSTLLTEQSSAPAKRHQMGTGGDDPERSKARGNSLVLTCRVRAWLYWLSIVVPGRKKREGEKFPWHVELGGNSPPKNPEK